MLPARTLCLSAKNEYTVFEGSIHSTFALRYVRYHPSRREAGSVLGCSLWVLTLRQRKKGTQKRSFFFGKGGIRTLERVLAVTRFPVVRLRPAQPPFHMTAPAYGIFGYPLTWTFDSISQFSEKCNTFLIFFTKKFRFFCGFISLAF